MRPAEDCPVGINTDSVERSWPGNQVGRGAPGGSPEVRHLRAQRHLGSRHRVRHVLFIGFFWRGQRLDDRRAGRLGENGQLPPGLLLHRLLHLLAHLQRAAPDGLACGGVSARPARRRDRSAQAHGFVPRQVRLWGLGLVSLQRAGWALAGAGNLRGSLAIPVDHAPVPLWLGAGAAGAVPGRQVVPGRSDVHRLRLGGCGLSQDLSLPGIVQRNLHLREAQLRARRHLRRGQALCG